MQLVYAHSSTLPASLHLLLYAARQRVQDDFALTLWILSRSPIDRQEMWLTHPCPSTLGDAHADANHTSFPTESALNAGAALLHHAIISPHRPVLHR
ncbi:hypothetical protein HBI56_138990 [Parastagonospora nodorum]|uniref:Uncharacterized protein n=1 Tax=Phaeosphaeria nodorum (strain SN15 / ATCC MYA-4574 / FGSC 10173) TaxID=321614 RepID=A0A7U2I9C5_PHANO|nr:hypothetical protein HBH56_128830 [Parastagonospora nodorum]QRD05635.1 hypothetical protein JI435_444700 [Parastagonospora nodorum SN15]KAH3931340.1 hypothetical protein HBH54_094670 [Parastagonospora nodorum]KAH3947307.1 hypothetical protein HBH53_119120 [Parastagonospora nodorum]KAH3970597.1 hypothetical protein HBH51_115540 [Parastagonospora nodorum]